jgi:hypothetical protein
VAELFELSLELVAGNRCNVARGSGLGLGGTASASLALGMVVLLAWLAAAAPHALGLHFVHVCTLSAEGLPAGSLLRSLEEKLRVETKHQLWTERGVGSDLDVRGAVIELKEAVQEQVHVALRHELILAQ